MTPNNYWSDCTVQYDVSDIYLLRGGMLIIFTNITWDSYLKKRNEREENKINLFWGVNILLITNNNNI